MSTGHARSVPQSAFDAQTLPVHSAQSVTPQDQAIATSRLQVAVAVLTWGHVWTPAIKATLLTQPLRSAIVPNLILAAT